MADRPVILVPTSYYLPGFKAGGPVRSIANLVDSIGDEFCFKIVCTDRDLGDSQPYEGITTDRWVKVGKAEVYYVSPDRWGRRNHLRVILSTSLDLLYLNSFFSAGSTIAPLAARRLGMLARVPVVLAPRGEFAEGALAFKKLRKRLFITAGKAAGLFSDILWQASSEHEVADIVAQMDAQALTVVAMDLPTPVMTDAKHSLDQHSRDCLRVVFLSRISPMKNLDYALRVLELVTKPLSFSIYGPAEDAAYYAECRRLAERLPQHVEVRWHGVVEPAEVPSIMAAHDLFFLPSRGENFGHVIAEALGAGTPVLVSDTTPWRGLKEAGVGWDLPLADPQAFAAAIDTAAAQDINAAARQREQVYRFARLQQESRGDIEANRDLFRRALQRHG